MVAVSASTSEQRVRLRRFARISRHPRGRHDTSAHREPRAISRDTARMKGHAQNLAILAAIVIAATAVVWVVAVPDEPDIALGDSAAAALFASIVLLGKIRRDHWQK
jgi:hypothetical protein